MLDANRTCEFLVHYISSENLGILAIVMIITIPLPRDKNRLETLLPGDRGTQGVSPSTLKGKVM